MAQCCQLLTHILICILTHSPVTSRAGTNLQALIDSCAQPGSNARIVMVISNKDGVKGLERAALAGIPTKV